MSCEDVDFVIDGEVVRVEVGLSGRDGDCAGFVGGAFAVEPEVGSSQELGVADAISEATVDSEVAPGEEVDGAVAVGAESKAELADGAHGVGSPDELELAQHNALAELFDQVRACSANGELASPSQWEEAGLVPSHMTAEDFEMLVYDYLDDVAGAAADAAATTDSAVDEDTSVSVDGDAAVDVNAVVKADSDSAANSAMGADAAVNADSGHDADADAAATSELNADAGPQRVGGSDRTDDEGKSRGLVLPEGFELVQLEGEWVLAPVSKSSESSGDGLDSQDVQTAAVQSVERKNIRCEHVKRLMGAHSYYLYDSSVMTDNYAHWAYLAAEDDPVITFVDCVREESRVYPRPLAASNLGNAPFGMSPQDVEDAWDAVQRSGDYTDIERTEASNGDVYYYSTEYLSPVRACALAEWDAVERYMNV